MSATEELGDGSQRETEINMDSLKVTLGSGGDAAAEGNIKDVDKFKDSEEKGTQYEIPSDCEEEDSFAERIEKMVIDEERIALMLGSILEAEERKSSPDLFFSTVGLAEEVILQTVMQFERALWKITKTHFGTAVLEPDEEPEASSSSTSTQTTTNNTITPQSVQTETNTAIQQEQTTGENLLQGGGLDTELKVQGFRCFQYPPGVLGLRILADSMLQEVEYTLRGLTGRVRFSDSSDESEGEILESHGEGITDPSAPKDPNEAPTIPSEAPTDPTEAPKEVSAKASTDKAVESSVNAEIKPLQAALAEVEEKTPDTSFEDDNIKKVETMLRQELKDNWDAFSAGALRLAREWKNGKTIPHLLSEAIRVTELKSHECAHAGDNSRPSDEQLNLILEKMGLGENTLISGDLTAFDAWLQKTVHRLIARVIYPQMNMAVVKYPEWLEKQVEEKVPESELKRHRRKFRLLQLAAEEMGNEKVADNEEEKVKHFARLLGFFCQCLELGDNPKEVQCVTEDMGLTEDGDIGVCLCKTTEEGNNCSIM